MNDSEGSLKQIISENNENKSDLDTLEELIKNFIIKKSKKGNKVTIFDLKIYLSKKYKLYVEHSKKIGVILKNLRKNKIITKEKDIYKPYEQDETNSSKDNTLVNSDKQIKKTDSDTNLENREDVNKWPYENNN